MVTGNSKNVRVFNFVILPTLQKFNALKIYTLYSMS